MPAHKTASRFAVPAIAVLLSVCIFCGMAAAEQVQSDPADTKNPMEATQIVALITEPEGLLVGSAAGENDPADDVPIEIAEVLAECEPETVHTVIVAQPDVPDNLVLYDVFTATAYNTTGVTATGTWTTEGRTLAVNPNKIPYGTHLWLFLEDGTFIGDYYAEDTGSNMEEYPYVIDIYKDLPDDECLEWGAPIVRAYVDPSEQ